MNHQRILFQAALAVDGGSVNTAPGAVLVQGDRILAAGSPQQVGSGGPDCTTIKLPTSIITPALVNSHAHLDLTHIGPRPYTGDFTTWVDIVLSERASSDAKIAVSVRQGVELSRRGGTALIGDIAGVGSYQPIQTLRECGMHGVSFLEVFGMGNTQAAAVSRLQIAAESIAVNEKGVSLGLQPHAPYSCGSQVYRAAVELGLPLSTHLAETLEEIEFVRDASGPIQKMLQRIGVWNDGIAATGLHPIDHLLPFLREAPFVAAHVNYIEDRHLVTLSPAASSRMTVAYCPRASAYFGHPHHGKPAHRYREMMACGINVALGTDSILCLDTADRMSILDEMRFLYQRDGTDPITLLRMATINGATALGADPKRFTLAAGPTAGLLAMDLDDTPSRNPLMQAMMTNQPPRWIHGPIETHN